MAKAKSKSPVTYDHAGNFHHVVTSMVCYGSSGIITSEVAKKLHLDGTFALLCKFSSALLALTGEGMCGGVAHGKKELRKINRDALVLAIDTAISELNTKAGKKWIPALEFIKENLNSIYA